MSGPRTYYQGVADRLLPWLIRRRVRVGSSDGAVRDLPVPIHDADTLLVAVDAGARAFFAEPVDAAGEVWFVLECTGNGIPMDGVRLVALKTLLVLRDARLDVLTRFDGAGGVAFFWRWGLTPPEDLPMPLPELGIAAGARIREETEKRLALSPERDRVGLWSGYFGDVTVFVEEGAATPRDKVGFLVRTPGQYVRVPYSLHERTGLAAVPVTQADLYRFEADRHAGPDRVRRMRRRFELPLNLPSGAIEGLGLA